MIKSTKEKILDAVEKLLAEQGVDGASLRAITTKAGANLGSIHYYFGSKQNLLKELLEARAEEHQNSRFEALKTSIDNGKKKPLGIVENLFAWFSEHREKQSASFKIG